MKYLARYLKKSEETESEGIPPYQLVYSARSSNPVLNLREDMVLCIIPGTLDQVFGTLDALQRQVRVVWIVLVLVVLLTAGVEISITLGGK